MEEQVKRLIRKSLHMRLQGMGRIDNIRTNEALIETWITAIVALGYADILHIVYHDRSEKERRDQPDFPGRPGGIPHGRGLPGADQRPHRPDLCQCFAGGAAPGPGCHRRGRDPGR